MNRKYVEVALFIALTGVLINCFSDINKLSNINKNNNEVIQSLTSEKEDITEKYNSALNEIENYKNIINEKDNEINELNNELEKFKS